MDLPFSHETLTKNRYLVKKPEQEAFNSNLFPKVSIGRSGMQTKDYVIVVLVVAVACLGVVCYALLTGYSPLGASSDPKTAEPSATIQPTPTASPTATPTSPTKPAGTVSLPTPSAPEFSVEYVDNSYDVPVTYTPTIDPFSGEEQQIKSGGYHVENKSIVITIKNQPFTPFTNADDKEIALHYTIRYKGHFGEDWYYDSVTVDPTSSSSIETYSLSNNYGVLAGLSSGEKVDFQVQAWIGYYTFVPDPLRSGFYHEGTNEPTALKESGWSSTQTLTIP